MAADPWDGRSLEWMIPVADAGAQLRRGPDRHAPRRVLAPQVRRGRAGPAGAHRRHRGRRRRRATPTDVHLPSPSYWPIVLAFGLPLLGYGLIYNLWLCVVRRHLRRRPASTAGSWSRRPSPAPAARRRSRAAATSPTTTKPTTGGASPPPTRRLRSLTDIAAPRRPRPPVGRRQRPGARRRRAPRHEHRHLQREARRCGCSSARSACCSAG